MFRRNLAVLILFIAQLFLCVGKVPGQTNPLLGANTIGVFRPSQGLWIVNASGTHTYQGGSYDPVFSFGMIGDQPAVGWWNVGGPLAVGVFRNGYWYLDSNNNQLWDSGIDAVVSFGEPGDIPVVGDWNHDGNLRIGVVRPTSYGYAWYVQTGCSSGANVCNYDPNYTDAFTFYWGQKGDAPVVGGWDFLTPPGPLRIGIVRSGMWIVNTAYCPGQVTCNGYTGTNPNGGGSEKDFSFTGSGNGSPVVGDWGLGYLSVGTFSSGAWNVVDRNLAYYGSWNYGEPGDVPVVGPWQSRPLSISTTSLSSGLVGNLYLQALTATGEAPPYHWSANTGSLPPGLSVSDAGTLSGTPTAGGSFHPFVTLTDSAGGECIDDSEPIRPGFRADPTFGCKPCPGRRFECCNRCLRHDDRIIGTGHTEFHAASGNRGPVIAEHDKRWRIFWRYAVGAVSARNRHSY
jgi:Putative Ig domain